ncbi:MAG: GNAT family N-acetyltransferase [Desulfobacula sp.]|jgi:acetyltransferase
MGIFNLDKFFNPASIAIIGASERPGSVGGQAIRNLQAYDYSGHIYPVNPKHSFVCNLPCVEDVALIPDGIDLAVIATPIRTIPQILSTCVARKTASAILVSDSGREPPHIKKTIENQIREIAHRGKIRVVGPDSMGFVNTTSGLNLSYTETMPLPGGMAFVSHSSSLFTATLDMAFKERMGFSYFISAGSSVDVDFADLVDYLGHDENVSSILLYIQHLKNPRKFLSAARSVSPVKPIVVLKPGCHWKKVSLGADDMETPFFEDEVYRSAFKRAGIVSVDSIDEMFDCAELMSKQPRPSGDNLVVITNGGAPGDKAVDVMRGYDIKPSLLRPETLMALDKILPPYWSRNNPVNLLSGAGVINYVKSVSTCLKDNSINALLIIMVPEVGTPPSEVARALVECVRNAKIPILAAWCGGRDMAEGVDIFNSAGIPTFRTPEKAVTAFSHLIEYNRNQAMALEIPAKLNRRLSFDQEGARAVFDSLKDGEKRLLTDKETITVLKAYGIPLSDMISIATENQAIEAAQCLGYPVTLRLFSSRIPQLYDFGNSWMGLCNPAELKTAFNELRTAAPEGPDVCIRVQPHLSYPDYALFMGIIKDENFGPVLRFGVGSSYSPFIGERNLGIPPLNRLLARKLMENTSIFKLLKGYRFGADPEKLEEMLIRLSQLAVDFPQIDRLDIYPVIVKNGNMIGLDARTRVQSSSILSPLHLVISPYPAHQEKNAFTKNGLPLHLRPVKPEDAPMFVDFIKTLSDTSIYYRFFRHIRRFSPQQIHRFTAIDYDRQIALIALVRDGKKETMLGVIRIIGRPEGTKGDFYLVVSDACQGQGIGSNLLYHGLETAFRQGYRSICGVVLPENEGMRKLAKKIGFQIKFNFSDKLYDLTIDPDAFAAGSLIMPET